MTLVTQLEHEPAVMTLVVQLEHEIRATKTRTGEPY